MKKRIVFIIGVFGSMLLYGCGSSNTDLSETTVIVEKNGKVTDAIVESFDKDYYDAAELEDMVNKELASYQKLTGSKDSAVLSDFKVEDKVANVGLEFATAVDYASFNDVAFFFGTISEAYAAGYDLDVILKSTSEEETIGKDALMEEMGSYHMIVSGEPIRIKTYGKILYTTANVDLIDDKEVRISSESEGLAYIILK